jgi:formylglycine-generating enzyme required for sulfatase activity
MSDRRGDPESTIGVGDPPPSPDQIRDEFERNWNEAMPTRIEALLARVPDTERGPWLESMIALEVQLRRGAGEAPAVAEYLDRFPGQAELVTRAFGLRPGPGPTPRADSPHELASTEHQTITLRPGVVEGPGTELEPGVLVGRRYAVRGILGRGGCAVVYLAHDPVLDRLVALKMPRTDGFRSDEDLAAFIHEARNAAQLVHPAIVQTYDVQKDLGSVFIVQQYIDGPSLAALMRSDRPAPGRAADLMIGAAEALDFAHGQGFVHRDIKPANILLDARGRTHLADFGLALHESAQVHHWGELAGTCPYMSPEQVRREVHRLDGRSDLWSLGVILYELLTGWRPFSGEDTPRLFEAIEHDDPRPPREVDPSIPEELSRICLKCLSKRAADRYETAAALVDDLRHWREGVPAPAAAAGARPPRVVPKGLRSFDAVDADFFLELLPGPRDREGMPESLRFWKGQLERTEPDERLAVCLMYGPSGSGKSSLVKAGLIPRLAAHVLPVYVEATARETEARLLRALRARCPGLPEGIALPDAFARLRDDGGSDGKKVVVVLDQFEQWLHATGASADEPLVRALRQCDGGGVQCLLLVRDDFWMSTTRLMRGLEIPLIEGLNIAAVDLFDLGHARKVLLAFGRAYGRLPDGEPDEAQEQFLDASVRGLAQDGKVIGVRLALFAQMMKGRPWTPASLEEVGGPEGVDRSFLEETFAAPGAPPAHKLHQEAARAVLKALLPDHGADIRGRMQRVGRLLEVSGYADRPDDFRALLAILDGELRLITPTEPHAEAPGLEVAGPPAEAEYYQLTHDFLIPSLRDWLTEKQRATPRGRAELRLEERTALWTEKPERRQLPSWREWVAIRSLVPKSTWTPPQRRMMRVASRHHAARTAAWVAAIVVLAGAGLIGRHLIEQKSLRERAALQVEQLWQVGWPSLSRHLDQMGDHPELWRGRVEEVVALPVPTEQRARGQLALARLDGTGLDALADRLAESDGAEGAAIRGELRRWKDRLLPGLWRRALDPGTSEAARFQAALALADYAPDDLRWAQLAAPVARTLLAGNPLLVTPWVEALRPVRGRLREILMRDCCDDKLDGNKRLLAAGILADFAGSDPGYLSADDLTGLVLDATPTQAPILLPLARARRDEMVGRLEAALGTPVPLDYTPAAEEQVRRRANAAEALLGLGRDDLFWPLLRQSRDPRLRTLLIDRIPAAVPRWDALLDKAAAEPEGSIRQAILLGLEGLKPTLSESDRARAVDRLVAIYESDPDGGVHSGAEWVLTSWGQSARVFAARRALAGKPRAGKGWFVTPEQYTMIVIPAPGRFHVGSPDDEPGRDVGEGDREVTIDYAFAISAHEVTNAQYTAGPDGLGDRLGDQGAAGFVSYSKAAQYCRQLSDREGVAPGSANCYPPVDEIGPDMELAPSYTRRGGYRLPTPEEWEYATRAGSATGRFFGNSPRPLGKYAWYAVNAADHTWPVGRLRPNPWGLFDVYGNVIEWCGPGPSEGSGGRRAIRGGYYRSTERFLRSAMPDRAEPEMALSYMGFRIVMALPMP